MSQLTSFRLMARYNEWMNRNVYDAAATLTDEQRKEDRGAFFHSIHGILNHLLVCDWIWTARFGWRDFTATSLDQELFSDFDSLRSARESTDSDIIQQVEALTEADLERVVTFRAISRPIESSARQDRLLLHFFNHQTHHRGQLTTLLDQFGVDYRPTDLMWMPEARDPDFH